MPDFIVNVIRPGILVNGSIRTDFRSFTPSGTTFQFNSALRDTITIRDNDTNLSGDQNSNERAADRTQQDTIFEGSREKVYVDASFEVEDSDGNTYTMYAIDVRESPNDTFDGNRAVTFFGFDASNPPPLDTPLTQVGEWNTNVSQIPYTTLICFARGTRIATPSGSVAVEDLGAGDQVATVDGPQRLRWSGRRCLSALDMMLRPQFLPIRIAANAMGAGRPSRDTYVSPQHRILVEGPQVELWFGTSRALVAAHALVNGGSIRRTRLSDWTEIAYHHILFDTHTVVWANGMQAESMLLAPQTLLGLSDGEMSGIEGERRLFGPVPQDVVHTRARHRLITTREARVLSADGLQAADGAGTPAGSVSVAG